MRTRPNLTQEKSTVQMKIEIKYTGGILNLPSAVADIAPLASEAQLKVLLCLAGAPQYLSDPEPYFTTLCARLDLSVADIKSALAFWVQKGVLAVEGLDVMAECATQAEGVLQNREPAYTGKQILAYVDRNKDFRALCNECQVVLGKSFTAQDYNNVRQLKEYYKFSDEYILLLLTHCVETERATWAYIRKTAANLYDEGISSYSKLEEHFSARRNKRSLEYKIRRLLGIGEREFTKTEKSYVEKWIGLKTPFELINKAYEITIEKTGKFSYAYMAKILDNWHTSGIKTAQDVDASLESYKNKQKMSMSTFDTDDFFEAALERSNRKMMERRKK